MTDLLVANVNNVIRGADGKLYRLVRGRTLAEAGHPAVVNAPQAFAPMEIHLPAPDSERDDVEDREARRDEQRAHLEEIEAERDRLVQVLTAIVEALDARGMLPDEDARMHNGWVVEAVIAAIDGQSSGVPAEDPVTPPRAARVPRKAAKPRAASDGA